MVKLVTCLVYHRLKVDARKMNMVKKILVLILFSSWLFGCEKRWIERGERDCSSSFKRRCFVEAENVCELSWGEGFVKGILHGWSLGEFKALSCGCCIAPEWVYHQLLAILSECYVERAMRNDGKIVSSLLDYLKVKCILIHDGGIFSENVINAVASWSYLKEQPFIADACKRGIICEDGVKSIAALIKMELENYNSFVVMLNMHHRHDLLVESPSYYS